MSLLSDLGDVDSSWGISPKDLTIDGLYPFFLLCSFCFPCRISLILFAVPRHDLSPPAAVLRGTPWRTVVQSKQGTGLLYQNRSFHNIYDSKTCSKILTLLWDCHRQLPFLITTENPRFIIEVSYHATPDDGRRSLWPTLATEQSTPPIDFAIDGSQQPFVTTTTNRLNTTIRARLKLSRIKDMEDGEG
jgi:hypothetical protein